MSAAENGMKEKIIKILATVMDNENISIADSNSDLITLGLDSVLFIRMAIMIEEEFNIKIPDSRLYLEDMNTIDKIEHVIEMIE